MSFINNPIDERTRSWSFIAGIREKRESFEVALARSIKKEMGIVIENIEYVSDSFYHARLSDSDVNNIQRSDNQLLDFFSLKEIEQLSLTKRTEKFISKHATLIS